MHQSNNLIQPNTTPLGARGAVFICFGEMLWDVLPTVKQPGGAPMNVAVHLKNLGFDPKIISRIGEDELGEELLDFIQSKGLNTDLVQLGKTHLTGVAKANLNDKNEVTYKIVHPVAWDYIQNSEKLENEVANADVFIFGSLSARSQTTKESLYDLLKFAKYKVFDVNLRAPFYDQETVEYLMTEADLVKMNSAELSLIFSWGSESEDEKTSINNLAKQFNISTICVTKGEDGALLYTDGQFYEQAGFSVIVKDTIGSGDSFLATLLKGIVEKKSPAESLEMACAMGSLVASHDGATPYISQTDLQEFIENNTVG